MSVGYVSQPPVLPKIALFVDFDLAAARALAEGIRDHWSVVVVSTAGEAMAALRAQAPTLLVTELDLPDMSGLRLLSAARAAAAGALLLVVTARSAPEEKIAAFDAGADDVLIKPVTAHEFRMHVQMLTRFRQVLDQE